MIAEKLPRRLADVGTLPDVAIGIIDVLRDTKRQLPDALIWYVSGMISSEGPEHIAKNVALLKARTERARDELGPTVFSPTDVFSDELSARIDATGAKGPEYIAMWRVVFESRLIHGVIFTARWSLSSGARDENETATRLRMIRVYDEKK